MKVSIEVSDYEVDNLDVKVVNAIANQLITPINKELSNLIRQRVLSLIDESVGSILAGVIELPIQKTNSYGEAVGGTMTLREVIIKQGVEWFSKPVDRDGRPVSNCSQGMSMAQYIANQAIEKGIQKDISNQAALAVKEVKDQLEGKVKLIVNESVKTILGLR